MTMSCVIIDVYYKFPRFFGFHEFPDFIELVEYF